jgi:uncharacterized protein YndB with AHSA1/START domain
MANSKFVYVIYIRTTAEKLWEALVTPEFTRTYWAECWQDSTWKQGAPWKLMIHDGRVGDSGEVLEIERPRKLVLKWQNEFLPEIKAEGPSRCTMELEPFGDMVKLTVTHEIDRADSKLIASVSTGWPMILSSLKSLLETGDSLDQTKRWPKNL